MTVKELSRQHEELIARMYGGKRSRSSGASAVDKGDVRSQTDETIFECKLTGAPGGDSKRTTLMKVMEKTADEAWAEGKQPAVCLRLFCPESPLSNQEGWVDMTVRLTADDCVRERLILGNQAEED